MHELMLAQAQRCFYEKALRDRMSPKLLAKVATSPVSPLYLPCISPISPLYLPCISAVSPLYLTLEALVRLGDARPHDAGAAAAHQVHHVAVVEEPVGEI